MRKILFFVEIVIEHDVHRKMLFKVYAIFIQQKAVPNAKVGFSKAMSAGWIKVDKAAEGGPRVLRKVIYIRGKNFFVF